MLKSVIAARREGAAWMRERAALEIDCGVSPYCQRNLLRGDRCSLTVCPHEMAEAIRALPLTPEEPMPERHLTPSEQRIMDKALRKSLRQRPEEPT